MAISKILIAAAVLLFVGYAAAGPTTNSRGAAPFLCRTNVTAEARNGVIDRRLRWPNGVVFYKFAEDSTEDDRRAIVAGMRDVSRQTCIRFRARTDQKNYIQFKHLKDHGCGSSLGMIGGDQDINLEKPGCMEPFIAAHEIIHALGFVHEQERDDRDDHIKVLFENIEEDGIGQFEKVNPKDFKNYGPYDLDSVMHYYNTAFSKNGKRTMEAIGNPERKLGNEKGLTSADRGKIRQMYNCRNRNNAPSLEDPDFEY